MLAVVLSYGLTGIDGFPVHVEVNLSPGLAQVELVGLPDAAVRESKERVRTALKNSGFPFPEGRLTVNLAPADQKKEGPAFDLPIALGILAAAGRIDAEAIEGAAALGELSLDGSIRPVRGALPLTISAREQGVKRIFLPEDNAEEVRCVEGIDVFPVKTLAQIFGHLTGGEQITPLEKVGYQALMGARQPAVDFSFVKGRRAPSGRWKLLRQAGTT